MTDASLTVRGGAHGVRADLDDLAVLAAALDAAAGEAAQVAAAAAGIAAHPAFLLSSALDPAGSSAVAVTLRSAIGRLAVLAAGCAALADAVRSAALVYRLSDQDTGRLLAAMWHQLPAGAAATAIGVTVTAGVLWAGQRSIVRAGLLLPAAFGRVADGESPREVVGTAVGHVRDGLSDDGLALVGWLVRHPGVAREALATVPLAAAALLPADPQPGEARSGMAGVSAAMLVAARPLGLFRTGPVRVTAVQSSIRPGPRDVAGVVGRLAHLTTPRGSLVGYEPNRAGVLVDRVAPAGSGPTRWIVYLPPTSDWGVDGGRYPSDLTSNVAMVSKEGARTGRNPDAVEQALTAMRRAGVRSGEPVMLVGFSQGGITAASLAADPDVRAEYQVDVVLTAGSPISEFALDDDVAVLSIENEADLVPELDGVENPDQPNWVTVEADVLDPRSGDPATRTRVGDGEVFAGHYLDGYVRTAERVDANSDPSVRAWRAAAEPFLTGAEVTTLDITVERDR